MTNKVKLVLHNNIITGSPEMLIRSKHDHNHRIFKCTDGNQIIETTLNLHAYDTLYFQLIGRDHNFASKKQTMISITNLIIDDINLQHLIYTSTIYPAYDLNFVTQHNPPVSYTPGTMFQTNGTCELDIRMPIYKFIVDSYESSIS